MDFQVLIEIYNKIYLLFGCRANITIISRQATNIFCRASAEYYINIRQENTRQFAGEHLRFWTPLVI